MKERFQRYAIYWTPIPDSPAAQFAALWFGGIEIFGLAPDLAGRAIKSPAAYGLHATLKAPFRLRDDVEPEALQEALDGFCEKRRPPAAAPLTPGHFQRYVTLVLKDRKAEIDWLAEECVTHFDRYRAALNDEDRSRREIDGMSVRQAAFLEQFGYPYVLSEFRFHISIAGPLVRAELDEVAQALAPHLRSVMAEPLLIEDLTLLGEPQGGGTFQPLSRHRFGKKRATGPA
jgi:hypothetical protein